MASRNTDLFGEILADWRDEAACAGQPDDLFFPRGDDDHVASRVAKAKEICAVCPVSDACLQYALETNQRPGIWGGLTEEERRRVRRKWLAERRRLHTG